MAETPERLEELSEMRLKSFFLSHSFNRNTKQVFAHVDPETGAGFILATRKPVDKPALVYFYAPHETRRPFAKEKVISNHMQIRLGEILKEKLAAKEALKTAPHDLKVGDVFCDIFGESLKRVRFNLVVEDPTPHTVSIVEIAQEPVPGDSTGERVVPVEPYHPLKGAIPLTHEVSMASGRAVLSPGILTALHLWKGQPVSASRT